jgi:tetratricopeptide (TPR) repeat protein
MALGSTLAASLGTSADALLSALGHGLAPTLAASAFGTFLLFLLLGLLALAVTAALDRSVGKEVALFLWAFVLVGAAFVLRPTVGAAGVPRPQALTLPPQHDASTYGAPAFDALARKDVEAPTRNLFQQQSDTSPLPPVAIAEPPAVPLPFPSAPTVPGLGPAARRGYRLAAPPDAKAGDGSKLPEVPADSFRAYVPKPEDVFDWIVKGGNRMFVYVKEIDGVKEGQPEFEGPSHPTKNAFAGLKWNLAAQGDTLQGWPKDWKTMRVTYAIVGGEERAKQFVADPRKARRINETTGLGGDHEGWFLRRTVDNLYVEACRSQGQTDPERLSVDALKTVASHMATVGQSGKEDGLGWRKAVEALNLALRKSEEPPKRDAAEVLLALIEAHRALHDEKAELATLAKYVQGGPVGSGAADGATWLGDVYLQRLRLPHVAALFYGQAVSLAPQSRQARLGRGDALSVEGDHVAALAEYKAASQGRAPPEASVRRAEALLRTGAVLEAKAAADEALAAASYDARALIVKGAVLYAAGDVQGARELFAQAAVLPGEGSEGASARRHRAEALYDLGLAEWRLGHADAASAAFDAADVALRTGSQSGRSPEETIATDLGRALLLLSAGKPGEAAEALERAKGQAPGNAYVEMLAGWLAATQGDPSRARPRFENALRLAPDLAELDGWLADVRLRLAEGAVAAGVGDEAKADFAAAVRFAERASATERRAAPADTEFSAREALVRLRNQDVSEKRRFEAALKTAEETLARSREDRRALAIKGYCNYRLGVFDATRYDQCLRDFQSVIDLTAGKPDDPLRAYARESLEAVKKWQSLEQLTIEFDDAKLSSDWQTSEGQGVKVVLEQGQLRLRDAGGAKGDGAPTEPTVLVKNDKLFDRERFEELDVVLRVPTKDASGNAINNLVFGLLLQSPGSRGVAKGPGLGVFYDKGKVALRVGGGLDPAYKDGELHRVVRDGKEREFDPDDETGQGRPVRVTIRRTNDREGGWTVSIGDTVVLEEKISALKRARGPLELWIGGWSSKAQFWNVAVESIRVVRRKS